MCARISYNAEEHRETLTHDVEFVEAAHHNSMSGYSRAERFTALLFGKRTGTFGTPWTEIGIVTSREKATPDLMTNVVFIEDERLLRPTRQ
jgi:hypothetical protein